MNTLSTGEDVSAATHKAVLGVMQKAATDVRAQLNLTTAGKTTAVSPRNRSVSL
jgi:hypothetical protein